MSSLMMIFPLAGILTVIAVAFLMYIFGFRRAMAYLFIGGLIAAIGSAVLFPMIFPSLNEGLGIGFLMYVIAGPILLILGLINLAIWIVRSIRKS